MRVRLSLLLLLLLPAWAWGQALSRREAALVNPLEYGSTCTTATLTAAINAAPVTGRVLMLTPVTRDGTPCVWAITSNVTVPSHLVLHVPYGASVSVNTGVTLTLVKYPRVDNLAWITGAGTVTVQEAPPEGLGGPRNAALDGLRPTQTAAGNAAALARALTLAREVLIPPDQTFAVASFTIPANRIVRVSRGAQLTVAGSITFSAGSGLLCSEDGQNVIAQAAATSAPLLTAASGVANVTIEQCLFRGLGTAGGPGLAVQNPSYWTIEGNIFEESHCNAIWIKEDSAFLILKGNTFRTTRHNPTEANCPSAKNIEVYFQRDTAATKLEHHRGHLIADNVSLGTLGEELRTYGLSSFNSSRIVNNVLENSTTNGIVLIASTQDPLNGSDNNVITGNTCRNIGNTTSGTARCIFLFNSANYNTVSNNSAYNTSGDGIHAVNSVGNIITNNILVNTGLNADLPASVGCIRLDGQQDPGLGTIIQGNICINPGFYGIAVAGNTGGTLISHNTITHAGHAGTAGNAIILEATDALSAVKRTVILGNNIQETGGHGILVSGDAAQSLIQGNHITDSSQAANNTYDGIHLQTVNAFAPNQIAVIGNTITTGGAANTHRYGINSASSNLFTHMLDNHVYGAVSGDINAADTNVVIRYTNELAGFAHHITNGATTLQVLDTDGNMTIKGGMRVGTYTAATLPTTFGDGTQIYCSDCLRNSVPCAGAGNGSVARREVGVWNCD